MPTYNRREFVPHAIRYFLRQDYEPKELIIIDDGTDAIKDLVPEDSRIRCLRLDKKHTIGAKRNLACKEAAGDIIMHWDDDDWMAPHRISYQVEQLLQTQSDVCGLDRLYFYDPSSNIAWQYIYPKKWKPWLAGGTLCYKKNTWKQNHFQDVNTGEDALFVWNSNPKKILALQDNSFYVALIHKGNTSPKKPTGSHWHTLSSEEACKIITENMSDKQQCVIAEKNESAKKMISNQIPLTKKPSIKQNQEKPEVTCILVTYNRREFVPQAIKYFLRQDYPEKQLIILDDGTDAVQDLVPDSKDIEYIRLHRKLSIGEKRNLGIESSQGEIILFWDDDDWYGPNRISYQVKSIREENYDATILQDGFVLDLEEGKFWKCKPKLRDRMFAFGVIGGTIAFKKSLINKKIRFPAVNLAEDAELLRLFDAAGLKFKKMPADDKFVYIRHKKNTWVFSNWQTFNNNDWEIADTPHFFPSDDLHFYSMLARIKGKKNKNINHSETKIKKTLKNTNQQVINIPLSTQGAMLYRQGSYIEALNCLEKAVRIETNNPWIFFDIGLCLMAVNRLDEALMMLQTALEKIPSNTWVWSAVGIALARFGHYENARHAFIKAKKISNKNNEAALFLNGDAESNFSEGIQKFLKGEYNSAMTLFDAAIFKDPKNHRALFYKGKILLVSELASRALPFLLSADSLRPNHYDTLLHIGRALIELGHREQAIPFLKKALLLNPQCLEAKNALNTQIKLNSLPLSLRNCDFLNISTTCNLEFIKYLNTGSGSLFEDYIFLYGITRLLRPNLVLEIGTNTGVSSIVFASALRDSNIAGKVVTMDYNKDVLETAKVQIKGEDLDVFVEIYEGESLEVLPRILKKYNYFDLCFLDGNHYYDIVKEEFEQVKNHCRYILLHDSQSFEGVNKFVEELSKCPDYQVVQLMYPPGEQWSGGEFRFKSSPGIALVEIMESRGVH
jgi:glycosyltransferase involved in cell wall biosynthesis